MYLVSQQEMELDIASHLVAFKLRFFDRQLLLIWRFGDVAAVAITPSFADHLRQILLSAGVQTLMSMGDFVALQGSQLDALPGWLVSSRIRSHQESVQDYAERT